MLAVGAERGLDRVGQTVAVLFLDRKPIDDDRDVVILVSVQLGRVGQVVGFAIDAGAHEAAPTGPFEQLSELAFPATDLRGQDLEPSSFTELQEALHDLRSGLAQHRIATGGTVRDPDPRPEQAEVVVDLGDGADGGAWIARDGLLLDRDRGRQTLNGVHIGLFHQPQELTGVGRERLHISALTFGVDGVESERALPGAGKAGDHHQFTARQMDIDVAKVVLARAAYDEVLLIHNPKINRNCSIYQTTMGPECQMLSEPIPITDYQKRNRSGDTLKSTDALFC